MRVALIVLVLVGCDQGDKKAPKPSKPSEDTWKLIDDRAKPLVPAGPVDKLAAALAKLTDTDSGIHVPETALDDLYAWVDAKGGLPWRGDRSTGDIVTAKLHALKLGEAAIERGGSRGVDAADYLAHRFRAEGGCLVDSVMGFDLDAKVPGADAGKYPPSRAELRRSLALAAVCARWLMDNHWNELVADRDAARRGVIGDAALQKAALAPDTDDAQKTRALLALQELVLQTPEEPDKYSLHATALINANLDSWLATILLGDGLPRQLMAMSERVAN